MIPKIGDRFRHISGLELETINLSGQWGHQEIVIVGNEYYRAGEIDTWGSIEKPTTSWEFLGNFSKTDKFNELYNLLNS